jgi:hypothetical protein
MDFINFFFKDAYTIWLVAIPSLILLIMLIKLVWPGVWKDDNAIEEKIEDIIKEKTSLDVDLTPSSPENK